MTILIDRPIWPGRDRRWAHLISDRDLAELHAFAASVGVPPRGFERDHYDVPAERWADVVAAGATPVDSRTLVRALHAAGLRRPKRDRR